MELVKCNIIIIYKLLLDTLPLAFEQTKFIHNWFLLHTQLLRMEP